MNIWKKIFGSNELTTIKVGQGTPSQPSSTPNRQQPSNQPSPVKAPERVIPATNTASAIGDSPRTFHVPAVAQGRRLYQWLAPQLGGMRRSEFESLLKQRRVLVDGKQRTDAYELSGGETIVITPPPPDEKPTINALEAPQGAKGAAASVPSQPLPKSPANSGITNTGSTQAAAAARVASPPLQKPAGDLIAADAGARTTKPAGASGKIGDEDRMNVSSTPEIVIVGPSERPLLVDPTSVGCGFVLIANKYLPFFEDPSRAHKALETNKTKLWEAVRRHEPDKKVLFLVSNQHIPDLVNALAYAFKALDGSGKYPGYSMTIDSMAISPDGGRTLVEFYVGLNWKSSRRELVLAGPQGILPGKL